MVDVEVEKEKILRLDKQWFEMEMARDVEGPLGSIIAEDAVFSPPGKGLLKGVEAIRGHRRAFHGEPWVSLDLVTERIEVSSSGDLAYQVGTHGVELEGGAVSRGCFCRVWKKIGEEWKCVVLIYNRSHSLG